MSLSLSQIRGIGPARLKALNDAGIWTARDLALMLPRDYRDLTNVTPLAALQAGVPAAVRVRVSGEPREQRARKLLITKVFVTDGDEVAPVVWYNQPWLKKQLTVGRELLLYGKAEWKKGVLQLVSPTIEQEGGLDSRLSRHSRRSGQGHARHGGGGAGGLRRQLARGSARVHPKAF